MSCPVLDNTGAEKCDFLKPSCQSHSSYNSLLLYWPGWAFNFVLIIHLLPLAQWKSSNVGDCIKKECSVLSASKILHSWHAVACFWHCNVAACEYKHRLLDQTLKNTKLNITLFSLTDVFIFWQGDSLVMVVLLPLGWVVSTWCALLQTLWQIMRTS